MNITEARARYEASRAAFVAVGERLAAAERAGDHESAASLAREADAFWRVLLLDYEQLRRLNRAARAGEREDA